MDDGAGKSISDLMNECDNFFQHMGSNRQIQGFVRDDSDDGCLTGQQVRLYGGDPQK